MTPPMDAVKPFTFEIVDEARTAQRCRACAVYPASVVVTRFRIDEILCRACTARMRATLGAAEKALPQLPRRPRPKEES